MAAKQTQFKQELHGHFYVLYARRVQHKKKFLIQLGHLPLTAERIFKWVSRAMSLLPA